MKIRYIITSLTAATLLTGAGCESHKHHTHEKAQVSEADARRIALEKAPGGTIKEGELEKEHGRLIWSFDIAQSGTRDITEVQVDANTGEVVSVQNESPEKEAREKKGEKEEDDDKK